MKKSKKIISLFIAANLFLTLFFQNRVIAYDKITYRLDTTMAAALIRLARELMDIFDDCHIDKHLGSKKGDFLKDKELIEKAWRNTTFMGLNPDLLIDAHLATRQLVDSLARMRNLLRPLASNNIFPNSQNCNQRIRFFFESNLFNEFNEWRNREQMNHKIKDERFDIDLNPEFVVSPQQSTSVCTEDYCTRLLPVLSLIGLGLLILFEIKTLNIYAIPKTLAAASLAGAAMQIVIPAKIKAQDDFELGIRNAADGSFIIEKDGIKALIHIDSDTITVRSKGLECASDLRSINDTNNIICHEKDSR